MIVDVTEHDFQQKVLDRSHEVPVVVDFWAEWCGPCRQLGPALERSATAREGKVDLAKLDTDASPSLAQAFQIRSIPAVKAFRDGKVVDEFVGAVPPHRVEEFFDRLLPSEADALAESGDEQALRRALELDPSHAAAAVGLGRILLARGDRDQAEELLEPFSADFRAVGMLARSRLEREGDDLAPAFAALDAGDHEAALERLQEALAERPDADRRDLIRQVMVGVFDELGPGDELAMRHRRRLASALY